MNQLSNFSVLRGRRLQLGVSGSIAAYKAVDLMRIVQKAGVDVGVTLTASAQRFITPLTFLSLGADPVYDTMFDTQNHDPFGHLEPGRVADAMVIAPATATTLSRLAQGSADEILSAQALAFNKPLIVAPAMNPLMWQNPATQYNVNLLLKRGVHVVTPDNGKVACGDIGQGRLAPVEGIACITAKALLNQDMQGIHILLTVGPTQEPWDGVRTWTNHSTGHMGAALAYAAFLRGATVHAVAGPGVPVLPAQVFRYDVTTAQEMFDVASDLWKKVDIGLFTAAVADFRPVRFGNSKFKKNTSSNGFTVEFLPNPDILAQLASTAGAQKILGFAAETSNLEQAVFDKLTRKKAHMIVGNLVGVKDSGFGTDTNRVFIHDCNGRKEHWPLLSKEDLAWRLLDWLLTL